ncbi:MAG: non-canonical purine NTP pyrophosphatase [Candidatus Micrarchaeia archaeon]|jgi:XTP/dITP diphosphohydrolase
MNARIIIATANVHKINEIHQLAGLLGWKAELVPLSDFSNPPKIVEDGKTYEENAKIKAVAVAQQYNLPALGEDSGMEVFSLAKAPGIFSARFMDKAGKSCNCTSSACAQAAANRDIIRQLGGSEGEERDAKYVSAACLAFPDGKVFCVKAECKGRIADKERGTEGFGFDPIFMPEEYDYEQTFGELGQRAKNSISHRRMALEALVAKIEKK